MISLIVAASENNVIGAQGDLPWRLPADLRHFKSTTMGHHLIIGRATWDEVGRPLPGRTMVVVTRNQDFPADGVLVAHSLEAALELANDDAEPFIGGGAEGGHKEDGGDECRRSHRRSATSCAAKKNDDRSRSMNSFWRACSSCQVVLAGSCSSLSIILGALETRSSTRPS